MALPRLAMLALVGATLLLTGSVARGQTTCSFSGSEVRSRTYVAGTALAATGFNRLITFPTATGCTGTVAYTLDPVTTAGSTGTNVPGLTFDGSVSPPTLTGTPGAPAGYSDTHVLAYTATDANGDTASIQYRITVEADSTPSFAQSEYAKTFHVDRWEVWGTPQVTGGNYRGGSQYTLPVPAGEPSNYWTNVVSGPLTYHRNALQITALPSATAAETSHVYTYTDTDGDSVSTTLKFTVANASRPSFFRDSVRINWILNSLSRNAYQSGHALHGAGGPGTTYALTGTLPQGMAFNAATRTLTGKPTEAGAFALTLTATDSNGESDTQAISLFVSPTTDPSDPPTFVRRSALSCTEIRLTWAAPRGGDPPETGFTQPAVTGYRIEGKQRGVDSGWRLIAEPGASDASYTHTVPPGSAWTYRVRANTAGGVNPWSPDIHASTTVNASRPYRRLESGMTLSVTYTTVRGGEITRFQWYRSPDQPSLAWSRAPGGPDGFYDVTDADVGRLIGVAFPAEEYLALAHDHTSLVTVIQSFAGIFDPVVSDESPSFATPFRRIEAAPAGQPINIQLPRASGGSGTIVHTLSPDLPNGLVFDEDALTITGTPATDWLGDYDLTARDEDCDMAVHTLAIGPEPRPASPELLPDLSTLPPPVLSPITMTVAETGAAPDGAAYGLRLECGLSAFTPVLAAGESYTAHVLAGSVCSLTATDRGGASEVLGEFSGLPVGEGARTVILTFSFAPPEPAADEQPEAWLDAELMEGLTVVRWRSADALVAEVAARLTLCVTAVHWWDEAAQSWRSWFPNADALGVNTLTHLRAGDSYFVFAVERDDAGTGQACAPASGSAAVTPSA